MMDKRKLDSVVDKYSVEHHICISRALYLAESGLTACRLAGRLAGRLACWPTNFMQSLKILKLAVD